MQRYQRMAVMGWLIVLSLSGCSGNSALSPMADQPESSPAPSQQAGLIPTEQAEAMATVAQPSDDLPVPGLSPTLTLPVPAQPSPMSVSIITAANNGQVFKYRQTSRFSVRLDPAIYPTADLMCLPEPVMGYISNGSSRTGYPVRFEVTRSGTCALVNGDFRVTIVGLP